VRSNEEIVSLIEDIKNEKKLSLREMEVLTGISKTALSRYFNRNRELPINKIDQFAKALNTTTEYLLGINEEKESTFTTYNTNNLPVVPVVGKVTAGEPNYAVTLPPDKKTNNGLIYLEVKSDSMNKQFPVGSYVLVDTETGIENGNVAVVKINGNEATLKQIKFDDNQMYLIPNSHNENYYPEVMNKEDNEVYLVGKVVGMYQSI